MIKFLKRHINKKYEAYPGDTEYIKKLQSDEISSSTLRKVAISCIVVCAFVDFLNISDLMNLAYDIPSEVLRNPFINLSAYLKPLFFTVLITSGIAFSSIFFGALYRRMNLNINNFGYKVGFIALICVIFTAAIAITIFRITAEYKSAGGEISLLSYDPVVLSSVYTAFMFIGIVTSLLYGMFGRDLLKEEFTNNEKCRILDDRNLFNNSKYDYVNEKLAEINYYEKRKDISKKIINIFRDIDVIASKLKCISDPADIHDIDVAFSKFSNNFG